MAGSGVSYRALNPPGPLPKTIGDLTVETSAYFDTSSNPTATPVTPSVTVYTNPSTMYGQADVGFVPDATSTSTPQASTTSSTTPQTPWQTGAYGTQYTNVGWNFAMGYEWTPLKSGQITKLGGFFNGTKVVELFDKSTRI